MKLIDKDAVVANVSKRVKEAEIVLRDTPSSAIFGLMQAYKNVLSLLDTIEVKEVDLDKEIELVKGDYEQVGVAWNNDFDFIAKHFFELGLQSKKGG